MLPPLSVTSSQSAPHFRCHRIFDNNEAPPPRSFHGRTRAVPLHVNTRGSAIRELACSGLPQKLSGSLYGAALTPPFLNLFNPFKTHLKGLNPDQIPD